MPPAFRNHRVPTACDTPTPAAASSLAAPAAIAAQNRRRSSRPATDGRPGEKKRIRPERSERRFRMFTATSSVKVLRRPLESALVPLVDAVRANLGRKPREISADAGYCMRARRRAARFRPILSNLVLDALDKELARRGHRFCRYPDDCNMYVRSRRAG